MTEQEALLRDATALRVPGTQDLRQVRETAAERAMSMPGTTIGRRFSS
jgi:hypothetical protein